MIRWCYINSRKSVFNYFFKVNSFLFVNATKIYQFKANDWEIKINVLCLGNISKEFTAISLEKKNSIKWMHLQIVDYNIIDASNIINILKYVMKKHDIKYCLELLNECLLYY